MKPKFMVVTRYVLCGIMALLVSQQTTAATFDLGNQSPKSQLSIANSGLNGVFQDNYLFSIPAASAGAISTSVLYTFGMSSIKFSLFSGDVTSSPTSTGQLLASSSTLSGKSAWVDFLGSTTLGAGSYTLQVSGTANTWGGSYVGKINIAPVPETDEWALLLAGIGLIGVALYRRQSEEAPLAAGILVA